MNNTSFIHCPICHSQNVDKIYELACGNLDNSRLYPNARISNCLHCGHIFNDLTTDELNGLISYYNDEYTQSNLSVTDKTGDRPGSAGSLTTERYNQLYRSLERHIDCRQSILDVGCALGGFLDYLRNKGFKHLYGVDMSKAYVEKARRKKQFTIELGNAESLPFDDCVFDVIVMEQVLEHLFNPVQAFLEARRTLRSGGIFCIGVPDATRYSEYYFFDFYWLLLREHIQHFDIAHVAQLGTQTGFELLEFHETLHSVMAEHMIMPNLYAVFRLTDSGQQCDKPDFGNFKLKELMGIYLCQEEERLSIKRRMITELIQSQRPVFVWGIGREFLYLYESVGLKHCNIAGLIDANPYKQEACSVGGMKIAVAGDLLSDSSAESLLLITAIAHTGPINKAARSLGFKGDILTLT